MKKVYGVLLLVFCTVIFNSCTNDTNVREDEHLRKQARFILDGKKAIEEELTKKTNTILDLENLTQQQLDHYLVILGYNPGDMTVPQVLNLIAEANYILEIGINNYLQYLDYQPFTKEMILELASGNIVNDFNVYPEFHLLPVNEQDFLKLCNYILQENIGEQKSWIECPSNTCGAALGFALGGIGVATCGPVCGGVGFVIGFIIGTGKG